MKNKLLTGFIVSVWIIIFNSSCQKKMDDAYLNPNAQTVEPVESLLSGPIGSFIANASSTSVSGGIAGDGLVIGRYIQYWGDFNGQSSANVRYDEMGGPDFTSATLATIWNGFYFGQGQNVNRIIQWGSEQEKWDYVGAAWAIRAWGWLELANEYADGIIVKEAFDASRQQFDYNPQSDGYDACRAACYNALFFLSRTDGKVSPTNFAIGDAYFYKGDVNKWKKFVYGILARSFAYLSNKSNYISDHLADSTIKYCDLAMTSNDDNATVKFAGNTNVTGTLNYFGPTRGNVGSLRQSAYIVNLMTGQNSKAFTDVSDPRVWYFLRANRSGTFKGIIPWLGNAGTGFTTSTTDPNFPPNPWGNTTAPQSTSPPAADSGRYLYRNTAEFPIMTASEMQFLKAEAALRKNDKATAYAAYKNAISLNFDMLSTNYNTNVPATYVITPSSKAAFMANTAVVPGSASELTLTHIMLQKYIALFGWGMHETWVDMRRFHYTDIDPATNKQVYADFTPPASPYLWQNNGADGKYVYRVKPQNNEYIYDIPALTAIGALSLDYHTKECWFSQP